MKKKIMVFLAFVLIFQNLFGLGLSPANAASDTCPVPGPYNTYGGDRIFKEVKILNKAGSVIDSVYNPTYLDKTKLGDEVTLEYLWELENGHDLKCGDVVEFDIPQEFTIYNGFTGSLADEDGTIFADFVVTESSKKGHVVITFNQEVTSHSNISGKMDFFTEISKTNISGSVEVPITFPVRGGVQVAKVFVAPQDGNLLKKDGQAFKAERIDWTIDVNTSLNKIDGAVLSDVLPPGLTLDPNSIRVYNLNVNVKGDPTEGSHVSVTDNVYSLDIEPDGSAFKVIFNQPTITSAYRIMYSTAVTDDETLTSFKNTAKLSGTNIVETEFPKTVPVVREQFLTKEKGNYNRSNQTVPWKVKYNYGQKTINYSDAAATIHDRFDDDMILVDGLSGVNVFDVSNGTRVPLSLGTDYSLTLVNEVDGVSGFDLTFLPNGNSSLNSKYDIEYTTQAKSRIYKNTSVTNTVYTELKGQPVKVSQLHTFNSNIGIKNVSTDYSSKINTWTIKVNSDNLPMTNLIVDDKFSGTGLEYIPGSLQVSATSATYSLNVIDPTKGFTLGFTGTINNEITITYKTKFYPDKSGYSNTAGLKWVEKPNTYTVNLERTFDPNQETINNGRKDAKYDASKKLITWDIKANYNGYKVDNAVFTDVLEQSQQLVDGSVKVYPMTVNAAGNPVKGTTEIAIDPTDIDYSNNTLIIKLGNINDPIWITFDTKQVDKTLVLDKIVNTANLKGNTTSSWNWPKTLTIPRGEVYVNKSGIQNNQNNSVIDWTIKINEGQSYVENARIIDTPSTNQILNDSSFKLYQAVVATGGAVSKDTSKLLTKGTDYSLDIKTDPQTDQQTFELKFLKPIETAYVLEYSSELAFSSLTETVTNDVNFLGDGVAKGTTFVPFEKEYTLYTSGGSGSGTGVRGSIEITKVDSEDQSVKLQGATFKLLKSNGDLVGEKVTGPDGVITFTKLLFDTPYTLIETQSPTGYDLDSKPKTIVIEDSLRQSGGIKTVTISNTMSTTPVTPKGQLEITKVDKANVSKTLEGATFVLQDKGNLRAPISVITDADGKAVFTDLLYDDYVLTETAAPQGYTIDSPNQTITIDSGVELTGGVLGITVTNSKTVDPGNPSNPDPGNPGNPWNPGTPTNPTNPTNPKTPKEEVPTPTKPVDKDEEYTAPEEPVPSDGTNGDKTKPGKTSNPSDIELDENGNPLGGSKGDKAKQNGTNVPVLPKTGENSPWLVQVVGAVLIVAGAVMLRRKFLINKK
ncbi:LPXTG-motif cell wall-anchored protein/uncharacterized repeat protein (TIGR01451 family) [Fontibacillus solani]|uniref:LPXTG-motif cell wall-anchored protein/uncharacterized repeat protein (TIGR01451 family) n=1 Tax=Fontibacillus solani TaxID=1572857 RepID=A0A7W3SX21_9BACL|nr:LPXTG cell wall anchor domain-containing protein [Fontibacillus solani]MBA9087806.1 LPXTG-motif cell wall-anchored protein/uncharacterized repeat protein (TIGR01451 family) [Fontibacillus solani]